MARGGFHDFNILVDRNKNNHLQNVTALLKAAHKHGYDTVAVNTKIDGSMLSKGYGQEIPKPLSIPLMHIIKDYKGTQDRRKFTVLQRLTIVLSDVAQTTKLQSSKILKEYDILAVEPQNEKVFQMSIATLNVDLICFSLVSRLPVLLRPQHVRVLRERGLFFEITYGPAMGNTNSRQTTISNAQHIVSALKGQVILSQGLCLQNLILGSQATSPMDLRGPYDVINLCQLFGAKGPLAAQFLLANGRGLVQKAECRKSGMGAVSVCCTSWLSEEDSWKTPVCKNTAKLTKTVKKRKMSQNVFTGANSTLIKKQKIPQKKYLE